MEAPDTVRQATLLWSTAVAAGVVETVLAVSEIAIESGLDSGTFLNIGLRSAVYIGAALLIVAFAAGRRWARASLTVLLSVIGLATMVVPAATALYDGEGLIGSFGGDGRFALAFFVTRAAHIAAVLIATGLMFSPSANRYFGKRAPEAVAA